MRVWHVAAIMAIIGLSWWWFRKGEWQLEDRGYPSRPIYVVVPYAAGGGSDTFVRIIEQGIAREKLLSQPLVIVNQAGGIGTIGSREVKNADPDGYRILCHHNAIITAKLAGTVSYGPEAFEPIALTGEMSMVILVRADAPFQNVMDLLREAKSSPRSVRFGANLGAPAYFTALQLEKALAGAEFSVVSSGGGADRYSKIIGGHLEAGIFSLSEYLDFKGSEGTPPHRDIRAIAVLSEQRHEAIPEVPTASELGVPVELSNANYWWAPKGTPPNVLQTLANALEASMADEKVREELSRLRMDPTFESGPALDRRLQKTIASFEAVMTEKPSSLPAFPVYVGAIVLLLFVWTLIDSRSGRVMNQLKPVGPEHLSYQRRPGLAMASLLAICVYVIVLGLGTLPFAVTTAIMVMTVGSLMLRYAPGKWWVLLELAILAGLGTQFIFTEIFVTDLP